MIGEMFLSPDKEINRRRDLLKENYERMLKHLILLGRREERKGAGGNEIR